MRKTSLVTSMFATLTLATALTAGHGQTDAPRLSRQDVKTIVAAMTLEEKVKLLVGMGMDLNNPRSETIGAEDKNTPEKVPGAAGRTHAIPRLGIPSLTLSDGPAGVRINPVRNGDGGRTFYATGFPIATLLASTWNTDLVQRVAAAHGNEVREYGIDILLAPAMNIHRNPLGGRNFEYYSEDPLIAGKIAAAYVKGVQSNGVGASIKHFAANNQEFNRMQLDTIVSERALREIYLKAFEIAVKESQPWTVMSSYNLINGTYASQSPGLLTTILRNEWGFRGLVMSDWFAGTNVVSQLSAGNDLLMPGVPAQERAVINALKDGSMSTTQLDESVERVLNLVRQSPSFKGYKYSESPDLKAHAQLAREAATQGMVLLKNDNHALPLPSAAKIALFGDSSYDLIAGGSGSGDVNKAYIISLDQGLAAAGYRVDDALRDTYLQYLAEEKAKRPAPAPFFPPRPITEMSVTADRLQIAVAGADYAVLTVGRPSGEFNDRKVQDDFNLSDAEQGLIENLAGLFHRRQKKVIVVLNIGGPIEVASWIDSVDAVLVAWLPGQEAGNAIVDILSGKIDPSGKLPMTFPVAYRDVPSAKTFPGREFTGRKSLINLPFGGKPAEVIYNEGVFVGYRYYNTFRIKPAFAFGYGLSYTRFAYSKLTLSSSHLAGKVRATVTVTNVGKVPGQEVVQLYIGAPKGRLSKPATELKAFAKTDLLRPGQSETINFTLTVADLASFDTPGSAWVADAGSYLVAVGASSLDIRESARLDVDKTIVVERVHKLLSPQREIEELKIK